MLQIVMRILFFPVAFLPRKMELFCGDVIGFILHRVIRLRINIVRDNYRIAYEKEIKEGLIDEKFLTRLEVENYRHYGRLCMELLHLPFDAERFAKKNVRVHGVENFFTALAQNKGVFVLTSHVGYWEIMSVIAIIYNVPLNVITKYLRNKLLDDLWVRSRERYGIKLIDENFTARLVVKAIRNKEAVGFVLDQFMGPPVGIKVNFFNKPAWTIASLAWFVEKTDAAIVPVVNYRNSDGTFDLIINKAIDYERVGCSDENIKHNTARYSLVVENFIRQRPSQWIWLHRRWKRVKEDDVQ